MFLGMKDFTSERFEAKSHGGEGFPVVYSQA